MRLSAPSNINVYHSLFIAFYIHSSAVAFVFLCVHDIKARESKGGLHTLGLASIEVVCQLPHFELFQESIYFISNI